VKEQTKPAKHGKKMIELRVRFWTDNIAPKGRIQPKHAWAHGVVRIEPNEEHGIKPLSPVPFNSLMEVGTAMEKVLIKHGIVLHAEGKKMQKYLKTQ